MKTSNKTSIRTVAIVVVVGVFVGLGASIYSKLSDRRDGMQAESDTERTEADARAAEYREEVERIEAERRATGQHCLNGWGYSHPDVVATVQKHLTDPNSFQHIETRITEVRPDQTYTLRMQFTAGDGGGGTLTAYATAEVSNETCQVASIEVSE